MANRSLGQLSIDLIARIGGFTQGMTQAERIADQRSKAIAAKAKDIEKAWRGLGKTIAAGFAGLTIGSVFAKFIQESRDAQNEQAQLAAVLRSTGQSAGYSADQLNAMADALEGTTTFSAGEINNAQTRLLSYTNVVGEQFPKALQAAIDMSARLGTSLDQSAETIGKALDVPSQGLTALSKQGFRFSEDQKNLIERLQQTGKTAEAQGIILDALQTSYGGAAEAARNTFGGAITGLQNQLNSLMTGDDGSLQGTTDAINDLSRTLASAEVKQAFNDLGALISNTIGLLVTATTSFINFGRFAGEALAQFANGSADPIERAGARIEELNQTISRLDIAIGRRRAAGAGSDDPRLAALEAQAIQARRELENLQKTRQALIFDANNPSNPSPQNRVLPRPGAIPGDQTGQLKKTLDGQIKLIRAFAEQQKSAYEFANNYLSVVYQDGLFSLQEFYDKQRAIRDAGVAAEVAALDKEIAALQSYRSKAGKPEDQIDAQNKIAEATQKRASAIQRSSQAAIIGAAQEAQAIKALQDRYNDFRATVLALEGNSAGSAAIQIARQVQDAADLINQAGGDQSLVGKYEGLLKNTQALTEAQRQYGLLLESARIQEESIAIAAQINGQSELETFDQIRRAREASLVQMADLVQKAKELASVLGTPEAIQYAQNLENSLARAALQVDPFMEKIRDIGKEISQSIAGGLEDAIVQGKGLNDVFKSLQQTIIQIVTRNLVTKPLEGFLGNFLGGNGSSGGAIGSALSGSGGGFLSNIFGGLGKFFGFFAEGGMIPAGGWGIAGEAGPEIISGPATVTPMSKVGGVTVHISQSFAPGTDRRTVNQAALDAQMALTRAQRNA